MSGRTELQASDRDVKYVVVAGLLVIAVVVGAVIHHFKTNPPSIDQTAPAP